MGRETHKLDKRQFVRGNAYEPEQSKVLVKKKLKLPTQIFYIYIFLTPIVVLEEEYLKENKLIQTTQILYMYFFDANVVLEEYFTKII
jgi:hypothetical protein